MTRRPLPDHVRQHLVDTGRIGVDGTGRQAQLRRCPTCRAAVVVGLDAARCALRVVCDPARLDQVGEAVAVLSGRRTYELWGRELERRNAFKIRAGMRKPVIAQHSCGITTIPDPEIIRIFTTQNPTTDPDREAPF